MLRSLVGSEMCIRDRAEEGRAVRCQRIYMDRIAYTPELQAEASALYAYCLLYTSDAADDLLCVDLGGRRIIKKKKEDNIIQSIVVRNVDLQYTHTPSHIPPSTESIY